MAERLKAHVELLASESLAGRKMGSEGGRIASEYIGDQFAALGLDTWGAEGYFHPFGEGTTRNVVGCIEGSMVGSYIVVGAHYDHLGTNREGEIFCGADDNASGTATLIEVARIVKESGYKPIHTLLFCAFDGEEAGLLGSQEFADLLTEESVGVMINMDMVGRLGDGSLTIEGTGTLRGAEEIITEIASQNNLSIATQRFERGFMTATDTAPFAKRGIPTLALTTGFHEEYHQPEDRPEKIDYRGLERIALFVAEVARNIDTSREVEPTGRVAAKHRGDKGGECEWGVTAAVGSNYHTYRESDIQGRSAGTWRVGVVGQVGVTKHIALRLSALYDYRKTYTPTEATTSLFGKAQRLTTGAVTIPAEVIFKTAGSTCAYLCVGGYGSRVLHSQFSATPTAEVAPYEWGWQWGIGGRMGAFYFEATVRSSFSPSFTATTTPHTNSITYTLGWMF